jgi:glutamine synthetase
MLCAGLDGIKNQIDPGASLDVDIYELDKEELAKIPKAPANLGEALANLESDHAFLTENGVFTEDFISTWISLKMEGSEADQQVDHASRVRTLLRLLIL